MPISIIKNFATCYCEKLASIFNDCLKENKFPNLMKIAEISPVFNYRSLSTLSYFTKLFESILFTQLSRYTKNKISKDLRQNSLLRMIASWNARLNNGSKIGVMIMDLSKTFDSLNHELLLAKLNAYGLDSNSVTFMRSYLTNRLQRCK